MDALEQSFFEKLSSCEEKGDDFGRVKRMIVTREDTRRETHALFNNAEAAQKRDRAVIEKNFVQAPAAQTMAPNLQKTAHVDAFIEEQRPLAHKLFPELQKAANLNPPRPVPNLAKRPAVGTPGPGALPVRSGLSGGAA